MTGLSIPNHVDPHTRGTTTAYAKIVRLNVDFERGFGTVALRVWATKAAHDAGGEPYGEVVQFQAGRDGFPDLTAIATATAAGWAQIDTYLYQQIAARPDFAGATVVS